MAFDGIVETRQVEDANGQPVSGALINFYKSGTLTRQAAYTDKELTTPAANPVVADSAGYYTAYLNPLLSYDIVITDSTGATTYASYSRAGSGGGGSNDPNVIVETHAELANLQGDENQDFVRVLGYAAAGDRGAKVAHWDVDSTESDNGGTIVQKSGVSTGRWKVLDTPIRPEMFGDPAASDHAAAINAALTAASTSAYTRKVLLTGGITYTVRSALVVPAGVTLEGEGFGAIITKVADDTHNLIELNGNRAVIKNLMLDGEYAAGASPDGLAIYMKAFTGCRAEHIRIYDDFGMRCEVGAVDPVIYDIDLEDVANGIVLGATAPANAATPNIKGARVNRIHCVNFRDEIIDINTNTIDTIISDVTGRAGANTQTGADAIDIGGDTCENIILSDVALDLDGRDTHGVTVKTNGTGSVTNEIILKGINLRNGPSSGGYAGVQIATAVENVVIQGLVIEGHDYGILGNACSNIVVDSAKIRNCATRGISFYDSGGVGSSEGITISDAQVESTGSDFTIYIDGYENVELSNVYAKGGARCYYLQNIDHLMINGGMAEGGSAYGTLIQTCTHVSVADHRQRDNTQVNLQLQSVTDFNCVGLIADNVASGYFAAVLTSCTRGSITRTTGNGDGGIRFVTAGTDIAYGGNVLTGFTTTKITGTGVLDASSSANGDNITT